MLVCVFLLTCKTPATPDCDLDNYEWQCDNGECIDETELCDGKTNCIDGSDEIAENCIHIRCAKDSFRCAYGGCIAGSGKCNGVKECEDNSDESPFLCAADEEEREELEAKLQGFCHDGEYECGNGECVDDVDRCDGTTSCRDKSDERVDICSYMLCFENEFQCGYGACIKGSAKCDGHIDCLDASDEASQLCGWQRKNLTSTVTKGPQDCEPHEWQCDNGECIYEEEVCEGKIHCTDHSDEIAENCIHRECAGLSFRCAYGACTDGSRKCNRAQDCVDRSDESFLLCTNDTKKIAAYSEKLQGRCQLGEFQCKSGDCIDELDSCDGVAHCEDKSDETAELCAHMTCSHYTFRCGYGACIKGTARCDGHKDCVDGSDEAAILCGRPRKPIASIAPTETKIPANGTVCQTPDYDKKLVITSPGGVEILSGAAVATNTILSYSCTQGHSLIGLRHNFCKADGEWHTQFPQCVKFCNATQISQGISTSVKCSFNDVEISTINHIKPETVCGVSCAYGFERPPKSVAVFRDVLRCTDDSEWDYEKVSCRLKCGEINPDLTPFTIGGYTVNITKVPWHVGIYSSFTKHSLNRTCSGSIISPHYVISAAHCFWNTPFQKLYDKAFFKVVAGNIYSEYKIQDNAEQVQIRNVEYIRIPENYIEDNYQSDIALLRVDRHFIFTTVVRPICIEYDRDQANLYIQSSVAGTFTGWGSDESGRDETGNHILQNVDVKTLSYADCSKYIKKQTTRYSLSTDKFCIEGSFGGSACRGDSGGGFIIKKQNIYYLIGVISHAPLTTLDCARDGVVAITNVLYFRSLFLPYLDSFGY